MRTNRYEADEALRFNELCIRSESRGIANVKGPGPHDGIIIGRSNFPPGLEGDALTNIAAFKSVAKAESLVETFTTVHE